MWLCSMLRLLPCYLVTRSLLNKHSAYTVGSGKALAKLKALVYCLWDMGDEVYLSIR